MDNHLSSKYSSKIVYNISDMAFKEIGLNLYFYENLC